MRYRRYGYLRLQVLLAGEGLVVNTKRTYRVCREEGLQVRKRTLSLHDQQPKLSGNGAQILGEGQSRISHQDPTERQEV